MLAEIIPLQQTLVRFAACDQDALHGGANDGLVRWLSLTAVVHEASFCPQAGVDHRASLHLHNSIYEVLGPWNTFCVAACSAVSSQRSASPIGLHVNMIDLDVLHGPLPAMVSQTCTNHDSRWSTDGFD